MDIDVRPIESHEFDEFMRVQSLAFGQHPNEKEIEGERMVFEIDRSLKALADGSIVGGTVAASFQLTVPGAVLPTAAITSVGVLPTHRRRGVMTALMRRQLDDIREREEPLAALHASESAIYGRFGYGLGSFKTILEIERPFTAFTGPEWESRVIRLISQEEALASYPPIFEAVRQQRPGFHHRNDDWWRYRFQDLEDDREGYSAHFYALSQGPEGPDGYVVYRTKIDYSQGFEQGTLDVVELIAADTDAYAALWRYCFDVDLMSRTVAWVRQVDEPLLHMLDDPRRLRMTVQDGLWVRVVDAATALAGRRYASANRLVLEVRDAFCPWNDARYDVEGGPEGAECRTTDAAPHLIMSASDLGAVYLGGVRFETLRQAGRVIESEPGGVRRADAMFAWDPLPWCPDIF